MSKKTSFYCSNESYNEDVGNGYVDRFMVQTTLVTQESENQVNKETCSHTKKYKHVVEVASSSIKQVKMLEFTPSFKFSKIMSQKSTFKI